MQQRIHQDGQQAELDGKVVIQVSNHAVVMTQTDVPHTYHMVLVLLLRSHVMEFEIMVSVAATATLD
jgi:hypothetical protein